jgi:hypothetical protein
MTETETLARELVDKFARGWSKANLDLICSVFADDAVFRETPFTESLTGLPAIRKVVGRRALSSVRDHMHHRRDLLRGPVVFHRVQDHVPAPSDR